MPGSIEKFEQSAAKVAGGVSDCIIYALTVLGTDNLMYLTRKEFVNERDELSKAIFRKPRPYVEKTRMLPPSEAM